MSAARGAAPALAAAALAAVLAGAGAGAALAASSSPAASPDTGRVASAEDTIAAEEVVEEGMEPVRASDLKDGVYQVEVDSSSSMFKVVACELTVEDGEMTAVMTMSGSGYLYLYLGTAEEAAEAPADELVEAGEGEDGAVTFTVPVEALDDGIDCAAFSKRREQWYARTLVFRADSLPDEAFVEGRGATVADLGLEDGEYTVEVALEGGSGRASVTSPARLVVEDGEATATVEWSSSNYDCMVVGDETLLPVNDGGNSTFEVPVAAFDRRLAVQAETTAMSTPHLIDYTLEFSSSSVEKA